MCDIDDVYVQMDWLLQSRPTPLDLYNRWENQNWSTQKLDFSEDRAHWEWHDRGTSKASAPSSSEPSRSSSSASKP